MQAKAKITSKGQITIPKSVRETLDLKPGGSVVFELKDMTAVIYPEVVNPLDRLKAIKREYNIPENEIADMIRESKADWDALG